MDGASPAELGGLLDIVADRARSATDVDGILTAAICRALLRHEGFTENVRVALRLRWHPDGTLDPGLGMPNFATCTSLSTSDRRFLATLRSIAPGRSRDPGRDDTVCR